MKKNKALLLQSIVLPLLVGVVASLITGNGMSVFETLKKPAGAPPGWLFPIVWTVLYVLMGISFYLVITAGGGKRETEKAVLLYWYQLAVNFLWPTFFFNFQWYLFAFVWLVLLWVLVLLMILAFYKIDKTAAWLNIPYLVWLTYAGYLNLGIWWLNR